jgi:hypothetical protein
VVLEAPEPHLQLLVRLPPVLVVVAVVALLEALEEQAAVVQVEAQVHGLEPLGQ